MGDASVTRRALIVGIDEYPGNELHGCVNDANNLKDSLSRNFDGSLNFECEVITAPPSVITKSSLREAISNLFSNPADVVYFHFSGHGTISDLGGFLVTPDAEKFDLGIQMSDVLTFANNSPVKEKIITLDCCNSGAFGSVPTLNGEKIILSEGLSIITATRSDEQALEEGGAGIFTSLLIEALDGGAAGLLGEITAAGIYTYLDNALGAWDQRPMFKLNVSRFTHLKNSYPKIDLGLLRKITTYFPLPAEELELSPEYEPSADPHNREKESIFVDLVKYRNVGLLEPIGEENMYHAAMHSKSCILSTLGKYYWRIVKDDKI